MCLFLTYELLIRTTKFYYIEFTKTVIFVKLIVIDNSFTFSIIYLQYVIESELKKVYYNVYI